jgi:hypothetical protein
MVKPLVDVTSNDSLHDPNSDDYSVSQIYGSKAFKEKRWGILYKSVRNTGKECAAILRPSALANCVQGSHYRYIWNGKEQRIIGYFKINENTFVEV